jgi:hypothetical protein
MRLFSRSKIAIMHKRNRGLHPKEPFSVKPRVIFFLAKSCVGPFRKKVLHSDVLFEILLSHYSSKRGPLRMEILKYRIVICHYYLPSRPICHCSRKSPWVLICLVQARRGPSTILKPENASISIYYWTPFHFVPLTLRKYEPVRTIQVVREFTSSIPVCCHSVRRVVRCFL